MSAYPLPPVADVPGAPEIGRDDRDADFVQLIDVVKQFGETSAVRHVELSVHRNELFALLGSSGCGKSTLLRMLAGFEAPTAGRILIDGQDLSGLPPYRRPVNMMFQSYALFPHMSVEANVAFGLRQESIPAAERRARVADVLDLVQMGAYAKRRPYQLSGGQQQRVALARSLVKRPKVLLLDEPMSALDKQIRQRTQVELVKIVKKVGVTCIMVTHDQDEAMTMADRLAVMSEGEIVQVGTPREVYEFPNCRFSAGFIGSTNLFDGHVIEDAADHVRVESADLANPLYISHGITGPLGMAVTVSVRPERIRVSRETPATDHNWNHGTVSHIAYRGAISQYHVVLASGKTVLADVPSRLGGSGDSHAVGDEVVVSWSAASAVVLTS